MKPKSARLHFYALLSFFLLVSYPAEALEVKEARWGFSDGVRYGHFNPVYALLYNDSKTENFDGEIMLRPGHFGPVRGVVETKKIFLAPQTSRWIQFGAMIDSGSQDWKLHWGSGPKDWHPMPELTSADDCWLVLYRKESQLTKIQGFRSCLDSFWPEHVALTEGVDSVFLDHEPDWTADQEKAFLDWLYLGGRVHLLKGSDSLHPNFFRKMKVLNGTEPMKRWGAGTIVRQSFHEFQLSAKIVQSAPMPFLPPPSHYHARQQINSSLVHSLAQSRPKPEHPWTLIFTLCFVYLLIIGPVNFVLARKTKSYRPGLLFLIVTISIFTITFYFLGRRGYKEQTLHYKVEYARSLGDGQFDVQSWNHLFVTDSDQYTLKQNSTSAFYGPLADSETNLGLVENGHGGQFTTKIPLFSTRSYLARHRMKTKKLFGEIVRRDHSSMVQFEIKKGPGFPKKISAWFLYNNRVYNAVDTGDSLKLMEQVASVRSIFGTDDYGYQFYRWNQSRNNKRDHWNELRRESRVVVHELAAELNDIDMRKKARNLDIHIVIRASSPDEWSNIDWPSPHKSVTYFQFTFPHEKR
ncbi:MAG: hypothetical protein P1V97_10870 [Planctomycetota bacterium]|nr:hypothetical protein [Planctomycetota bacterium]